MLHVRIRDARIAAGLSQEKLAALAGIPRSVLQNLETPGHDPQLSTVRKIAVHLPQLRGLLQALDGAESMEPRDTAAAREALAAIIAGAQRLLEIFGAEGAAAGGAVGAVRFEGGGISIDQETRDRIARLDAAVDRGEIPLDDEH